jgi:hypothetical protein
MNRCIASVLVVAAAALATRGCTKVVINPNDKSLPGVEIKVRGANNQYEVVSTASLAASSNDQLELMCIVTDPDGVKSITVTFSSGADHCTLSSGAVYDGAFTIKTVPSTLSQTLQGDASQNVLTKLPMLATLRGPFTCSVPSNGTGTPYGDQIKVTCIGQNWSSNAAKSTAQTTLTVSLH